MIGTPVVDWNALGQVVFYSVVGGIGVPALFALSIRAAARSSEGADGMSSGLYALLSAVCGLVCLGAVVLGIVLLTTK